jgi:alpha-glucosidase
LGFNSAISQTNNLIGENICVFYPAHYDAKHHTPSFALLQEPKAKGEVPGNWVLKPHFYFKNGKTIATLPVAEGTSLYGTGENTDSLIRNDKKITLWNTDNYKYQADSGKPL